jgi:chromosome segregation ATPase
MSDTPETDDLARGNHVVPTEWAEQLEKERDDVMAQRNSFQALSQSLAETCTKLKTERDKAREKIERQRERIAYLEGATHHACGTPLSKAIKERDEAIRQLNNIKATEIHTCHDQCQRPMCVLRRERDEARASLEEEMKFHHRTHSECVIAQCQLMDVTNERDKARHEIEGWRNKWECAVEMAATAENQRDEYRALLIRIYNDINVLHTGDAIRELTREFRDENFN